MIDLAKIEQVIEQLPDENLAQLAAWLDDKCRERGIFGTRDHSAFLSSYAPGDEGLYDEPTTR